MQLYRKIYEFAASAGALEGFVYEREGLEGDALRNWTSNLVEAYQSMPTDARDEIQSSLDRTLGRAIRSLMSTLGEEHEMVKKLNTMVVGPLPESADDFDKKKWFEE